MLKIIKFDIFWPKYLVSIKFDIIFAVSLILDLAATGQFGTEIMTTKILPIPREELKKVPAMTKTGRVSKTRYEYVWETIADEQECIEVSVNYNGKQLSFWITSQDIEKCEYYKEHGFRFCSCNIYKENGERIMAYWQHGFYGTKIHTEPALYDMYHNDLVTRTDYQDGRVQDSYKYLRGIIL